MSILVIVNPKQIPVSLTEILLINSGVSESIILLIASNLLLTLLNLK